MDMSSNNHTNNNGNNNTNNVTCNIQFLAKIFEQSKIVEKTIKKKKSTSSLNKSKSKSKSTSKSKSKSRSRSKSKESKSTSVLPSQIPKANGSSITIGKKLSKGTESFSFDKVFDENQTIVDMYKTSFKSLVQSFVFENKNISIIHCGNQRSKQDLWINDVNSIDNGFYGKLIDDIFDQITLKNLQNGDGQLITVKMSFYEVTDFQENIIDLLNDHSPYQNMESLIVSKEIFDLDDFLEIIQYLQENNLFGITEKQGKTQVCKIRLMGANSNCEMNLINLEDTDNFNKEREDYYNGFFREIKDSYISQRIIQSKNTKYYNFSRLTQTLQQSFNQNSAIVVLSSFLADPKQHLTNLITLKFSKRLQNVFKFDEDSPQQTKLQSNVTTNYNSNNPDQNQSSSKNNFFHPNQSNTNFYGNQSMSNFPYNNNNRDNQNQQGNGMMSSANNFISNFSHGSARHMNSNSLNNQSNSPRNNNNYNLFSNLTSNYQSMEPGMEDDQQFPVFGKQTNSTHYRSHSTQQFMSGGDNNNFNNNNNQNPILSYRSLQQQQEQSKHQYIDQINSEIDQVNESIQHPPVSHSSFFTKWIKTKAEFIESILTNISTNKKIDGQSKNYLLDKVLNLKSQLFNLNEIQNASPRSLPDRLLKDFGKKRTSSSPDLKQQREKLFEYFETPRFELEGRHRRITDQKRVSMTNSDQKIISRNSSIRSVIKSPSSKNISANSYINPNNSLKAVDSFANYYNNARQIYPEGQRNDRIPQESEDNLSSDSMEDQLQPAMMKKKQQKSINFKGTKKPADKKSKNSSLSNIPKKKSTSNASKPRDRSTSQGNLSVISKKSTQSRKSILSKKSATSIKSDKSKKSIASKKSTTSKKSTSQNKSKLLKKDSTKSLVGKKKSAPTLIKKNPVTSKRNSASIISNKPRQSLLKSIKTPTSLNRSRSSGQGDNSTRNYKDMKDSILQDLEIKNLRGDNSPSLSHHSRKTSLSKSPRYNTNIPALRGRTLSRDFYQNSMRDDDSQNQSYYQQIGGSGGYPYDSNNNNGQQFQNIKITDQLYNNNNNNNNNSNNNNLANFTSAVQQNHHGKTNSINLFQTQPSSINQNTQMAIRQNIKSHLKAFRDLVQSSSSESDYDLHYKITQIQPNMPMRKSYKFQSKVKEYDLSFENEKKFFIEQQGKTDQTDLLKNYHKLLLKSNDIQKLLDEQVNINDELQKEVFAQEEKFNILQKKHLKKKKEKQLIMKEMTDKLQEFEKMEQRDAESRKQLSQHNQKITNIMIQNEQQDKIIRNLETQISEMQSSYESRINELEEIDENQKTQIQKLTDIISRNQQSEMDLRSLLNQKSQQFDHDMKNKREEFERQLVLNQLALKQVQASKQIDQQTYDKNVIEAAEEIERLQNLLTQMKQKLDINVKLQKLNEENQIQFRKDKTELQDRIEELEMENKKLKDDKLILQHKNQQIAQKTISSRIQNEKNMKDISQSLQYFKQKQDQQQQNKGSPYSINYCQDPQSSSEQETRIQQRKTDPSQQNSQNYIKEQLIQQQQLQQQQSQLPSQMQLSSLPTNMYQNLSTLMTSQQQQQQQLPQQIISQIPSNNIFGTTQSQNYINSSPNQFISNPNQTNLSISQYEAVQQSHRDDNINKTQRNPSNFQQNQAQSNSISPLQQQQQQLLSQSQSQQNQLQIGNSQIDQQNLRDFLSTPNTSRVSKKGKEGLKTKRIMREPSVPTNDQQQLISTQREPKKKQLSTSLKSKSKNVITPRITPAPPKLKKK